MVCYALEQNSFHIAPAQPAGKSKYSGNRVVSCLLEKTRNQPYESGRIFMLYAVDASINNINMRSLFCFCTYLWCMSHFEERGKKYSTEMHTITSRRFCLTMRNVMKMAPLNYTYKSCVSAEWTVARWSRVPCSRAQHITGIILVALRLWSKYP